MTASHVLTEYEVVEEDHDDFEQAWMINSALFVGEMLEDRYSPPLPVLKYNPPIVSNLPTVVVLSPVRQGRADTPLTDIVDWWRLAAETPDVFPDLAASRIGWSRPFCFACGWCPPVEEWTTPATSGWLDRAHLVDHALGGSSDPRNLVPLCLLCHDVMPQQATRAGAVAWVRQRECELPDPAGWQAFTDSFGRDAGSARSRQARTFRLRGDYLTAYIRGASGVTPPASTTPSKETS